MNAVNAIRTVLASGTPTLDCTADASSLHAAIGALAGAHVLLVYEWLIKCALTPPFFKISYFVAAAADVQPFLICVSVRPQF